MRCSGSGFIQEAQIDHYGETLYRYLNFDKIGGFEDSGRVMSAEDEEKVLAGIYANGADLSGVNQATVINSNDPISVAIHTLVVTRHQNRKATLYN